MLSIDEVKRHFPIIKYMAIHSCISTILGLVIIFSIIITDKERCIETMTQCNITMSEVNNICYWTPVEHNISNCIYPNKILFKSDICNSLMTLQNGNDTITIPQIETWTITNCSYDTNINRCPATNCEESSSSLLLKLIGFIIILHPWITILIYSIFCLPFTNRFTSPTDLPKF